MIFFMVAPSMVSKAYAGDEKLFVNVGKLSGKGNYTVWVGALSTAFLGATVAAVVSARQSWLGVATCRDREAGDSLGTAFKKGTEN